jgi:hypothetical protein
VRRGTVGRRLVGVTVCCEERDSGPEVGWCDSVL